MLAPMPSLEPYSNAGILAYLAVNRDIRDLDIICYIEQAT